MSLTFKVVTDIAEAKAYWQEIVVEKNLSDSWVYRSSVHAPLGYRLHFIVGFENDQVIGFLPLQFNERRQILEFFGGSFVYDTRLYVKPGYEWAIPEFYQEIKGPAELFSITGTDPYTTGLPFDCYQYILPLDSFTNLNDFLEQRFDSKHRNNLKRKIKLSEQAGITVDIGTGADLKMLMELNRAQHGAESAFNKPEREAMFQNLIANLDTRWLRFMAGDKIAGISMSICFNGTLTYVNLGTDRENYPHLGAYVALKTLESAILDKCKIFDAGIEDLGWKEDFGLEKIPEYIFKQ